MSIGIKYFNVRDYGAAGNGKTKDTAAIQKAIDSCASAGGGTVLFPPGAYLSGTVYMRDNISLEIMHGAILKGSMEKEDYNADDFCPQNGFSVAEKASGAHLVVGVEVKNISVKGGGRIDGSGQEFFYVPEGQPDRLRVKSWRPGQMIFLCECENARIEGVELVNSSYWTCFLHGCEDVMVRGVRIWNDYRTVNGDGIDVDCCRRVVISDCIIETGDDCITLRGNVKRLKNPKPCEDISVSNCILKTRANGVRVGVGSGIIRNGVFSNLVIGGNALDGICIQSNYCAPNIKGQEGVEISNLMFQNIIMTDVISALYISPGYAGGKAISDISFQGIKASAKKGSTLRGSPENPVRRITLAGISMHISGRKEYLLPREKWEAPLYEWDGCTPAAFYIADCQDIYMSYCCLKWGDTEGNWLYGLWGKRLKNCRFDRMHMDLPPGSKKPFFMD
ncbi:MAG TPA: glycosyl hydrolase family 28 protein, partial [bacterium]|nr:glycosyl hydrolase family 28 protein [bacterium]